MSANTTTPQPVWNAAGTGRRLWAWRPPNAGPNQGGSIDTVVTRVRDLVRNNPWAGAALDRYVSNSIATGIQAKAVNGTPEQKARVDQTWKRWSAVSDADHVLTFEAQQALAARAWKEAGECFARLRNRRAEDGLPVPLQVQLIESEQCPRSYYATAPNGNQIREGVEFNAIGRRVAYWMYGSHPGDMASGIPTIDASQLRRIPADQVIHLYRPARPGQIRGVSDFAGVAAKAYGLDRISDNVDLRMQVGNLFSVFFKKSAPGDSMLDETAPAGIAEDDGTPIAGLEPGTAVELPEGWEPVFSNPPNPGSDYAEYMRFGLLAFAARVGIPAEVLTGDLRDVSDRALKLILLEFHRLIEMDLWLYFVPQFCQRIRAAWWDAGVLAGALIAPGYAADPETYRETLWMPEGWPYSHPVQDVTADERAIAAGLTSRTKLVLRRGEDPQEIDAEQAADNARADALGLRYTSDGRHSGGGQVQQDTQQ